MTKTNSRYLGDAALLPMLDPLNREWFTRGVIAIQRCSDCETFQHPPDEHCGTCQGAELHWRECAGEGRIGIPAPPARHRSASVPCGTS